MPEPEHFAAALKGWAKQLYLVSGRAARPLAVANASATATMLLVSTQQPIVFYDFDIPMILTANGFLLALLASVFFDLQSAASARRAARRAERSAGVAMVSVALLALIVGVQSATSNTVQDIAWKDFVSARRCDALLEINGIPADRWRSEHLIERQEKLIDDPRTSDPARRQARSLIGDVFSGPTARTRDNWLTHPGC